MRQRAMFWEEDAARAAADRVEELGFDADVTRERFAGEDDDEDHPWVLLSEGPATLLEDLVEEHEGWLDEEAGDVRPPCPLPLPDAPRRVKGHFREP
jgi:hypothetical protein